MIHRLGARWCLLRRGQTILPAFVIRQYDQREYSAMSWGDVHWLINEGHKVGGFDGTFPSGQDYELWLRLSPFINLGLINEVLGVYVEREGNISSRPYSRRY